MADVFISYHEASAGELAQKIAEALDAAGISSWCARRDMPLGDDFARHIPKQIQNCRLFLWILNNDAYHSRHIEHEVGLAFRRLNQRKDIIILPIETPDFVLDDGEWIAYYLIQIQSGKLPQADEAHIRKLVQTIAARLGHEPQKVAQPSAKKIIKSGYCGNNATYTLDENGVLMISGNGPIRDFFWSERLKSRDMPWWNERANISLVQIQNGVTVIGRAAFDDCAGLTSVNISKSVNSIKGKAFYGCKKLTNVNIPDSVTYIGNFAFYGCTGLTSVSIPDSVTFIGNEAFWGCDELTSVSLPAKTEIGFSVFSPHINLTRRE